MSCFVPPPPHRRSRQRFALGLFLLIAVALIAVRGPSAVSARSAVGPATGIDAGGPRTLSRLAADPVTDSYGNTWVDDARFLPEGGYWDGNTGSNPGHIFYNGSWHDGSEIILGPSAQAPLKPTGPTIRVVAAENFWGSVAAQLGGAAVNLSSIISSPDLDPHEYDITPGDGRTIAGAKYFIYNGLGYDPWADKILAANNTKDQVTLEVQKLLGLKDDDNPHRWYSPSDVRKVIDQITSDYKKIDPQDSAFFDGQHDDFLLNKLQHYNDLVQQISQKYGGTPIGATESIVSPLADALGLKMLTPYSFLQAISEGSEPTPKDKATFDDQIAKKQIAVLLFNTQNATPDVQRLVDAAKSKGIPIVNVTETLYPAPATFQDWQSAQLQALADALAQATGR